MEDYFRNDRVEMHRVAMCIDCVLITANGETNDGFDYDAWQAGVEATWPAVDGWHLGNGWSESTDGETDRWYSTSACEACGNGEHGDREYGHVSRNVG